MIRATGRPRSDASPSRTASIGGPARMPGEQPEARPGVAAVEDADGLAAGRRAPGDVTR